ncbi:hypothetical protein [Nocardioides pocheonensis]|uniref:Uncharacterized protein n=1 Tax=Nocardioides pocheonensis TaxID=661485 RepID=A0A3N0GYE7_9ACTN|nr:hypothetical protein [Nocardioides pocheonensis]RNM17439.1 hypothetical protein EFL26_01225 [Nocardioides pocheonensis]
MATLSRESDHVVARTLGALGLLLVCGWGVVALAVASVRTYDDVAGHRAVLAGHDWSALLPLPVALALSAIWAVAFLAVGLGLALGAAGLAVAGRQRAAAAFFGVVTVCVSADYLLEVLRSGPTWQVQPDRVAALSTTAGIFAAPLAGVVAAVVLLGPMLRTGRSIPEPAAAG